RQRLNRHRSAVLWFTGLSASGKSTISVALEKALHTKGIHTYRLDGDNIRHGLNNNLGFRPEDRTENIRPVGDVAKLWVDAGLIAAASVIPPEAADPKKFRQLVENE